MATTLLDVNLKISKTLMKLEVFLNDYKTVGHEWTVQYEKSSAVSKKTNCYKSRKFHFNNDDEHKSLTSYDAAVRTCRNKNVANFKTIFNVRKNSNGSFSIMVLRKGYEHTEEVYDESMKNIKLV